MFDLITSERCALAESSKIKGTKPGGGEACGRVKFWVRFI